MKVWLVGGLLVAALAYVLWARRTVQHHLLGALVRAARGDAARGRRAVIARQLPALVAAVVLVVAAGFVEQQWQAFWIRIPLCLIVIGAYAPFASALAPVWFRRVRIGPAERMTRLGAPPQVAVVMARTGRPFALAGSVVTLLAVLVLAWHHSRG